MNKIQNLHEKHNIHPELSDFHLTYQYNNIISEWRFMGWRCIKCGHLCKFAGTVPKHPQSCRAIKKRVPKEDKAHIITVNGDEWQPFDFNQ